MKNKFRIWSSKFKQIPMKRPRVANSMATNFRLQFLKMLIKDFGPYCHRRRVSVWNTIERVYIVVYYECHDKPKQLCSSEFKHFQIKYLIALSQGSIQQIINFVNRSRVQVEFYGCHAATRPSVDNKCFWQIITLFDFRWMMVVGQILG